jgi:hypothetical protein
VVSTIICQYRKKNCEQVSYLSKGHDVVCLASSPSETTYHAFGCLCVKNFGSISKLDAIASRLVPSFKAGLDDELVEDAV